MSRRLRSAAVGLGTLLVVADPAHAADRLNLDFETPDRPPFSGQPAHWATFDPTTTSLDSTVAFSGRRSLRFVSSKPEGSARAFQFLPSVLVAGKRVRLAGIARTRMIDPGRAEAFQRARGVNDSLVVRSQTTLLHATTWTPWSVEATVPFEVLDFWFGVQMIGPGEAWFDSLSITIDGQPHAALPIPLPYADSGSLLADAELVTDPDPLASPERGEWTAWLRENAHSIRSLTAERVDDLAFLRQLIGERRIVLIGTDGHGVAQFHLAATRLVRFLHEQMGFELLAVEGGFYPCWRANQDILSKGPSEVLKDCLGTSRHRELVPLFEYVRSTQGLQHPLILAGIDIKGPPDQPSGRTEFLLRATQAVAPELASKIARMESALQEAMRRGDSRALVRRNPHEWTATYDDLAQRLENGLATLRREFAPDSTAPIVACQIARGTSFLATALASDVTYEATRDEGMADNVECLLRLHPSAKIIVIAHNDHVRHANAWVARDPVRRMGTWIKSKHPDGVYTVGMKMYRGQAAFNDGRVYDVRSSEPGTLESSLFHAGRRYHFVDLLHAAPASGTAWMFSPIESFSWGWFRETFVPRDQYDGLLFVDTVSPAQPLLR